MTEDKEQENSSNLVPKPNIIYTIFFQELGTHCCKHLLTHKLIYNNMQVYCANQPTMSCVVVVTSSANQETIVLMYKVELNKKINEHSTLILFTRSSWLEGNRLFF